MIIPDIFQVEDDVDFAFFMSSAVRSINKDWNLSITKNGSEALDVLTELADANERPGMVLLDIDLPGMSGIDLLKKIRQIRNFDAVPIIMFSTSDNPKDVKTSLEFGANGYQTKPSGYINLVECLRVVTYEWMKT